MLSRAISTHAGKYWLSDYKHPHYQCAAQAIKTGTAHPIARLPNFSDKFYCILAPLVKHAVEFRTKDDTGLICPVKYGKLRGELSMFVQHEALFHGYLLFSDRLTIFRCKDSGPCFLSKNKASNQGKFYTLSKVVIETVLVHPRSPMLP